MKSEEGLVLARERLERAYAWLEGQLAGRTWAAGATSRWQTARPRPRCSMRTGRPDFRRLSRAARLPHAVACPTILRPGGRGGAAVSASLPPGSAGSGLKPRATSHCPTSEQSGYLHSRQYTSGKRAARSLLCALGFPVRPQIFPALAAREFCSQPIEFPPESRSASVISKPEIGEIPCIFPVIREFDQRRGVRCGLRAQPTSRGFSRSLPAFRK